MACQLASYFMTSTNQEYTTIIKPVSGWFDFHLAELWRYRDLILLFVRRDFVAVYKQTILGPVWFFIQPIFTTIIFTIIFGRVAKIPTDQLPGPLFYLSGIVAWNYFAACLNKTSDTFVGNAGIFGKVYFPRLVVPIAVVINALIAFGIQLLLLVSLMFYYSFQGMGFTPSRMVLLLPLLILQMAVLGLGCGIVVSSLTTKYRDLIQLVGFGVQLWMYATPIFYPISILSPRWQRLLSLNPMAPIIETFRNALLGAGMIHSTTILVSIAVTLVVFFIGLLLFSRIEKSFMDTV
ncbi:MAG: ABC transporter permease [Acidobacteriia bacterium]|nr:ABC transporter permease [Terriglobia bacterium]